MRTPHLAALFILIFASTAPPNKQELVFPGAMGFGVETRAGRGGDTLIVTTLEDGPYLPGSLRSAVEHPRPRVVVFAVSGEIHLERRLRLNHPFISILGQTAPGAGVTIRDHGIHVTTHDVLIQHLRIRVGDCCDTDPGTSDGIAVTGREDTDSTGTYRVVIDHCSISWAMDENASIWGARDVTISNCIISEALDDSRHPKGPHSMGMLTAYADRQAILRNLFAHCASRTPKLSTSTTTVCVNNVIYNPRWLFVEVENAMGEGEPRATIVGNECITGPDTKSVSSIDGKPISSVWVNRVGRGARVFENDHAGYGVILVQDSSAIAAGARVDNPPVVCDHLTLLSRRSARDHVLDNAGAAPRDSIDARIVREVRTRSGRIVDAR